MSLTVGNFPEAKVVIDISDVRGLAKLAHGIDMGALEADKLLRKNKVSIEREMMKAGCAAIDSLLKVRKHPSPV